MEIKLLCVLSFVTFFSQNMETNIKKKCMLCHKWKKLLVDRGSSSNQYSRKIKNYKESQTQWIISWKLCH